MQVKYILKFSLVLMSLAFISCNKNENEIKFYDTGQLEFIKNCKEDTCEYREYYKNGRLRSIYYTVNDKLEKIYYTQTSCKTVDFIKEFKNGKIDGYYYIIDYYPDTVLIELFSEGLKIKTIKNKDGGGGSPLPLLPHEEN